LTVLIGCCGKLVELPNSFRHLKNLENLDLEGSGIQNLFKSFGMLSKLKVLNSRDYGKVNASLGEDGESFGALTWQW